MAHGMRAVRCCAEGGRVKDPLTASVGVGHGKKG